VFAGLKYGIERAHFRGLKIIYPMTIRTWLAKKRGTSFKTT